MAFAIPERQVIILTTKQRKFCDEYLKSRNATDAALRAGYSPKTAERASDWINVKGQEKSSSKFNQEMRNYLDEELERIHSEDIADATEVLTYLTSVMRGKSQSEVIVTEFVGEGCSVARPMLKHPDERERTKAAEDLAKCLGLFDKKTDDIAGGRSTEEDALTASLRELAKEMDDADQ